MIFAMWHGGPNYAGGYVDTDLETFHSIRDAAETLWRRENAGGHLQQSFHYADGRTETATCPCVEDSQMTVWLADPRDSDDPYPDRIITLGPRGGIRIERI